MNRPHGTLRVGSWRDPSRLGVGLYLSIHTPDGKVYAVDPASIQWKEMDELAAYAAPTLLIPDDDAPKVAEVLAREGYGPSRAERITGELDATKAHLADMRALALHQAGVPS